MDLSSTRLAILGGTGPQGRGLAVRFVAAGMSVAVGSRDVARAAEATEEVSGLAMRLAARADDDDAEGRTAAPVVGGSNADVCDTADVVVVAVPWAAHADTLRGLSHVLRGRVVVDCVNPLGFDDRGPYALEVAEGSAAEQAQALLPHSRVVAAFHHVSAELLLDPDVGSIDGDVLVLADDREAAELVIGLAGSVRGMRGVFAGRLRNARQVEALSANLIAVNKRYGAHAGLRVTDV